MSVNKKERNRQAAIRRKAEREQKERRLLIIGACVLGVVILALVLTLVLGNRDRNGKTDATAGGTAAAAPGTIAEGELFEEHTGENYHHVEIDIENYGTICLELDSNIAPITVENFLGLAGSGFYDGLTFHRIMDGFMMQGGDPEGNGYGGLDTKIKGEFAANGWNNTLSHTKGVLSMARSNAYDSASCQFFICQADSTFLDGSYAAFGYVTSGIAIVDRICADARPIDNNGTIPAAQQPVMTAVRVID